MFQLSMTAGNSSSNPLETAVLLNSLCGVLKWIFLIISVITINNFAKSNYKKRNANPRQEKHSYKNTKPKEP